MRFLQGYCRATLTCAVLLCLVAPAGAQSSGGSFQITSSVVAGGGGSNSSGGTGGGFNLDGTPGQPGAGTPTRNPPFSQVGGFWPTTSGLAPTAAEVSVAGQITTAVGVPLGGVIVVLNGAKTARTITNAHGLYSFNNLDVGSFYALTPALVNYIFAPASRSFSLEGNKTDAVFTALPTPATANPLDTDLFFVRQQYLDFLSREPDAAGLEYWVSQLERCGNEAPCLLKKRIDVSAAFFIEAEFQNTGSFIYGLYKASFGTRPNFDQFSPDRVRVIGGDDLASSKTAFASDFVQRPDFLQRYPQNLSGADFIDALLNTVSSGSGVDLYGQRGALLDDYTANGSRSRILRLVAEGNEFSAAEYNRAFVLMQYFGYLRRDPDTAGYQFWLDVLNNREPNNYRGMVCSFITSLEYQNRFGSIHSHSNSECGR